MADTKEILFICNCGIDRSPTGASLFNKHFKEEGLNYVATSRGAIVAGYSEDPLDDMVARAHKIIAVDAWIAGLITSWFPDAAGKTKQLQIPNEYSNGDPYLVRTFEEYYQSKEWE